MTRALHALSAPVFVLLLLLALLSMGQSRLLRIVAPPGAPSCGTLPMGWSNTDIGSGQVAGSACYNSSTSQYEVNGSGEIYLPADKSHIAYQTKTDSWEIVFRLVSISSTMGHPDAEQFCGATVRQNTSAGSKAGHITIDRTGAAGFTYRLAQDGATALVSGAGATLGRLSVTSGFVRASYSTNGTIWTDISTQNLTLTGSYLLGLGCSNTNAAVLTTGVFADVSFAIPPVPSDDFGNFRPQVQGLYSQITGGRGGTVYHVTTLVDTGTAGSLRDAVQQNNTTVVFDVGGWFELNTGLYVTGNNLTIAGQTAPAPGVHIRATTGGVQYVYFGWFGNNIITQHIAVRGGAVPPCTTGIVAQGNDLIFDHVSVAWMVDESTQSWQGNHHLWHKVFVAEGIYDGYRGNACSVQWGGGVGEPPHAQLISPSGSGVILQDMTTFRSVFANTGYRAPAFGSVYGRFLNNLVYSYFYNGGTVDNSPGIVDNPNTPGVDEGALHVSFVGNRYIPGPANFGVCNAYYPYQLEAHSLGLAVQPGNQIYFANSSTEENAYSAPFGFPLTLFSWSTYDPRVGSPPAGALLTNYLLLASTDVEAAILADVGSRPSARQALDTRVAAYVASRGNPGGTTSSSDCYMVRSHTAVGGYDSLTPSGTVVWSDAANPNVIASGQVARTNRDMKLETEACALEPGC